MTFDEAFNQAAERATGRARMACAGVAPSQGFRTRIMGECRSCCREWLRTHDRLPTRQELMSRLSFGWVTALWVLVLVVQLLNGLRDWWDRGASR